MRSVGTFVFVLMLFIVNLKPVYAQVVGDQPTIGQLVYALRENPENRRARWALAQASFAVGRYDVARFHVERLLRTSKTQTDIDLLKDALTKISKADPWNIELGFSLLPSTNIRRYTYNDEFVTTIGTFIPVGGGEEESGIGVSVGVGLSYSLGLPDDSRLTLRARVDQNSYNISELNQTQVLFAARREDYSVGSGTTVEPYVRFRYDENRDLERRDIGLTVSKRWWLDGGELFDLSATAESREEPDSSAVSGPYGRLSFYRSYSLNPRTRMGVRLSLARSKPHAAHLRYWEGRLSTDVSRRFSNVGTLGVFGSVTARRYDGVFPATNLIREDDTVTYGASYIPNGLKVFESVPKLSCQRERNESNIGLYDYETTDCRLTFERAF